MGRAGRAPKQAVAATDDDHDDDNDTKCEGCGLGDDVWTVFANTPGESATCHDLLRAFLGFRERAQAAFIELALALCREHLPALDDLERA